MENRTSIKRKNLTNIQRARARTHTHTHTHTSTTSTGKTNDTQVRTTTAVFRLYILCITGPHILYCIFGIPFFEKCSANAASAPQLAAPPLFSDTRRERSERQDGCGHLTPIFYQSFDRPPLISPISSFLFSLIAAHPARSFFDQRVKPVQ